MHISPGIGQNGGSLLGSVQIENIAGALINPATEGTSQSIAGFNIPKYDYIAATYPDAVTEVYTFKTGGSGGATVGTLTVVYTDATKAVLSSVAKT